MTEVLREADPALRPVGGVEEVQVVGALSDAVAALLGLGTGARSVWIHPGVVEHIRTQRGITRGDADFVLSHLAAAILHPDYCGADPRAGGRFDLVYLPEGTGRAVFVALKFVAAALAGSGEDEIWVSTCHPLPGNFLARRRYRDSLKEVRECP